MQCVQKSFILYKVNDLIFASIIWVQVFLYRHALPKLVVSVLAPLRVKVSNPAVDLDHQVVLLEGSGWHGAIAASAGATTPTTTTTTTTATTGTPATITTSRAATTATTATKGSMPLRKECGRNARPC